MKKFLLALLIATASASLAEAQNVKNPTRLTFNSPDALRLDRHEMEIVRVVDSVTIQSLTHAGPYTSVDVLVPLNVQPVAFGTYFIKARACVGTLCSVWSDPSNLWDRVPGKPSKPDAQ